MIHKIGAVYQICFVVPDIKEAVKEWTESGRAGPFYLFEHFEFENPLYKGNPGAPDVSIALGYSGDVNIEFIEQHCDTPSIYRNVIKTKGYGFHHFALLTKDMDQSLKQEEAMGNPCTFSGSFGGGTRFAYADSRATKGVFTEYVEYNDEVEGLLCLMKEAAKNWDGIEPLRKLEL